MATKNDVLSALQRAVNLTQTKKINDLPSGAFTARDYANKTGVNIRTALVRLEAMVTSGQFIKGVFNNNGHVTNYYTNP